jgi:hypothetical protein
MPKLARLTCGANLGVRTGGGLLAPERIIGPMLPWRASADEPAHLAVHAPHCKLGPWEVTCRHAGGAGQERASTAAALAAAAPQGGRVEYGHQHVMRRGGRGGWGAHSWVRGQ